MLPCILWKFPFAATVCLCCTWSILTKNVDHDQQRRRFRNDFPWSSNFPLCYSLAMRRWLKTGWGILIIYARTQKQLGGAFGWNEETDDDRHGELLVGRISQCIGRIILFAVHSELGASSRELFLIRRNILRQFCLPFRKTLPAIRYMAKEQDRNGKLQTEI